MGCVRGRGSRFPRAAGGGLRSRVRRPRAVALRCGPGSAIWGLRPAVRDPPPWSGECELARETAQADVRFVQRGARLVGWDAWAVACVSNLSYGIPDVRGGVLLIWGVERAARTWILGPQHEAMGARNAPPGCGLAILVCDPRSQPAARGLDPWKVDCGLCRQSVAPKRKNGNCARVARDCAWKMRSRVLGIPALARGADPRRPNLGAG